MTWKALVVVVLSLGVGTTALAQSDQQRRDRTHKSMQDGIRNTPSPAQPPRADTGTRSGGPSSLKGYQGKPHNYNRPPSVSPPVLPNYRFNSQGRNMNPTNDPDVAKGIDRYRSTHPSPKK